jgi:hypothetical protein
MTPLLTLDSTMLIDILLGKDTTPEVVDMIRARLEKLVLPWRPNSSSPCDYVRTTALGREVAIITARLGGYGDSHYPRHHGWGYGTAAMGQCIRGIERVDFKPTDSEKTIAAAERVALLAAMTRVDQFLVKELGHTLLHEPLKETR